jgi:hypothetical protein
MSGAGMRGSTPLLVVFFCASVEMRVRHGTQPPDGGNGHHAQTVPHYSAGYSSGCADFFESTLEKTLLQFEIVL